MKTDATNLERIQLLSELFWRLSNRERRIASNLYRLLALGGPVTIELLARHARMPQPIVAEQLERWPGVFRDRHGRVEGFWGLTFHPMKHRLMIHGRTLYTWCAWDTLFIPLILDQVGEVRSACEATGDEISLRIGPEGVTNLQPLSAVVSFVIPQGTDWTRQIVTSFCHWVHYFRDHATGLSWAESRNGAFLLSVADGFRAAQLKVRYEYGDDSLNEVLS